MTKQGAWCKHANKVSSTACLVLLLAALGVVCQAECPYQTVVNSSVSCSSSSSHDTNIFATNAEVEDLADGSWWAEGPVWIKQCRGSPFLLYSDIPQNKIMKWGNPEDCAYGSMVALDKSCNETINDCTEVHGFNGLTLDTTSKKLTVCEGGMHRITQRDVSLTGDFVTIVGGNDSKLNSPNDVVFNMASNQRTLYFTDPPYGLEDGIEDDEYTGTSGVYYVSATELKNAESNNATADPMLLEDEFDYPNGLAFSPDGKTMYLSVSDEDAPMVYKYAVDENGELSDRQVFFDGTERLKAGLPGLTDGLKVDDSGRIFATAPGGVVVLSPQGDELCEVYAGGIRVSNVAFGDGYLYMTAESYLMRVELFV